MAQLAKSTPHLLVGAPGIFSDARERVGCREQWEATAPIKSLVKLQTWFQNLQWKKNCSLGFSACSEGPAFGQNTDDDDDDGHYLKKLKMTFIEK